MALSLLLIKPHIGITLTKVCQGNGYINCPQQWYRLYINMSSSCIRSINLIPKQSPHHKVYILISIPLSHSFISSFVITLSVDPKLLPSTPPSNSNQDILVTYPGDPQSRDMTLRSAKLLVDHKAGIIRTGYHDIVTTRYVC